LNNAVARTKKSDNIKVNMNCFYILKKYFFATFTLKVTSAVEINVIKNSCTQSLNVNGFSMSVFKWIFSVAWGLNSDINKWLKSWPYQVLSVYVTTLSIMAEFQSCQFKADSFPCQTMALNLTELLTEVLDVNCLGGSDIDITFKM
jgi:hypothetical protein